MRFQEKRQHIVDLLFPIALFFVFAVSALTVILLAARIYRSVSLDASRHDTARTSLAYISEKIRQGDADGSISLGEFDGQTALILKQSNEDTDYYTYIYAYEGKLMELFVRDGTAAAASSGKLIMPVADFSMEQLDDSLFSFTCTDTDGHSARIVAGIRSNAG